MVTQFLQLYEVRTMMHSISQMNKLRQRKVELAQGDTIRGWESWDSHLGSLVPKFVLLTTRLTGHCDASLTHFSIHPLLGPGPTFP